VLRRSFRNSLPPKPSQPTGARISATDLPLFFEDQTENDVCIGLPSDYGGMAKVLLRQRLTLREAIEQAGHLAEDLAAEHDERVLTPEQQPSAMHVVPCPEGCQIWLDYDLGAKTKRSSYPYFVRKITILLFVKHEDRAGRLSSESSLHKDKLTDGTSSIMKVFLR